MPKIHKTHLITSVSQRAKSVGLAALAVSLIGATSIAVYADQYDEQIRALNNQNAQTRNVVNSLAAEASSYQGVIDTLQAQIYGLQAAINENTARQTSLQNQIAEAQAKLDTQKKNLATDIEAMYTDGELSTIEQLATSADLNEFVDKEEYRISVQNKISAAIKEISALQIELQRQKGELDALLNTQKQQRAQLASAEAEQQQLLAYNEGQQAAYNAQISANNGRISELKRQQAAANARFTAGPAGTGPACGGGYPAKWCEIPMDSVIDSWGMYNRECVSYTAWKVWATGRYMPYWGGIGNANMWDDNARRAGYPVDTSPQAGDVAISNSGYYGHAMYVESVNDDGTINISQYNASWDGRYSTRNNMSTAGLVFITFPPR